MNVLVLDIQTLCASRRSLHRRTLLCNIALTPSGEANHDYAYLRLLDLDTKPVSFSRRHGSRLDRLAKVVVLVIEKGDGDAGSDE